LRNALRRPPRRPPRSLRAHAQAQIAAARSYGLKTAIGTFSKSPAREKFRRRCAQHGSGFGGGFGGFSESLLVQTRAESVASMLRVDAASASLAAGRQQACAPRVLIATREARSRGLSISPHIFSLQNTFII
jgi:hypothetical protein